MQIERGNLATRVSQDPKHFMFSVMQILHNYKFVLQSHTGGIFHNQIDLR
jgi:hypothetical protein